MARPKKVEQRVKELRAYAKSQIAAIDERLPEFKLLTYIIDGGRFKDMNPDLSMYFYGGDPVRMDVTVKAFADVLPLLEKITEYGYDFTESRDAPEYGMRYYISDRIKVAAALQEGDESCKRVVIGYTEPGAPRPIYEFRCGDPTPLPPPADNPLPVPDDSTSAEGVPEV